MKVALTSLNVKYIHKNLALRWLYVSKPKAIEARIIEGTVQNVESCLNELLEYDPDVVGLSCFIFNVDVTRELILKLKEHKPQIRILLGGPEATYNDERFWDLPIEGILKGEAEFSFWEAVETGSSLGLQTHPTQIIQPLKTDLSRLETLESPYFLQCDEKDRLKRYLYVETSRGCPYGCSYCMASLDRKVRRFSMPYLERFFETLKNHPVQQVKFLDRSFNLESNRALELAKLCVDIPKPTTFHVELVGDQLDEDLLNFFIQHVDRFRMEIGVQSFYPKTLEAVGRPCNLDRLKRTIRRLSEVNAHQHTDLIAGLPYEDLSQFKDSVAQMLELKPLEIQCGILKLLKGTHLYDQIESYQYAFSDQAPYTVMSNAWMNEQDIKRVEACALGIEKCYNSGRLRKPLQSLCEKNLKDSFEIFERCGYAIQSIKHPYTLKTFYRELSSVLSEFDAQANDWIQMAYYAQERLRPTRLFEKENLVLTKSMVNHLQILHPTHQALWIGLSDQSKAAFVYTGNCTYTYHFSPLGEIQSYETHHRHS